LLSRRTERTPGGGKPYRVAPRTLPDEYNSQPDSYI